MVKKKPKEMKFQENLRIFLVVLAWVVQLTTSHKDTKDPRDVLCNYIEDDRGYVCDIVNLKLYTEDDPLRFTGEQLKGKTNEDVKYLHIRSSESFIVPSENIFSYFVNLEKLEMRGVSVKKVDPIVNCMPLELIILSDNQITSLIAGTFVDCESLEVLDLSKNEISKMSDNAFTSLKVLRELNLSHNKLVKLTRKSLKPMKKLRKLSLQNNELKEIPHDVFNDLFDLQYLDLSANPLARIDFRVFDFIIHVETLIMKGTEIKKLHPFTFKNLRRLRYLDISDNALKVLEDEMFSTNKEMVELHMDNCGIEAMGRQFFDKLNKLEIFHANQNNCVDGIFRGDVVDIRTNFITCLQNWDETKPKAAPHFGDEL